MTQRTHFQQAYLVLLCGLLVASLIALGSAVPDTSASIVLLISLTVVYAIADAFAVTMPTARPNSVIDINVADAVFVFAILTTGSLSILPIAIGSAVVRFVERRFEQPLGYIFNLTFQATTVCVFLAATAIIDPTAVSGSASALLILVWMAAFVLWSMLFMGLLVSVGSGQPVLDVFRQRFLPTLWIESAVVALGCLAAILYHIDPWLMLPISIILVLAYHAIRAIVKRLDLLSELDMVNRELSRVNADLERQVAARTIELERALQAKSDFVSIVAHELRTPLTSIIGAMGVIDVVLPPESPAMANRLLDVARQNSDRLARLINDILDIQKADSRQLVFNMQLLDIADIARHAADSLLGFANLSGVRIVVEMPDECHIIAADPERLTQVVVNLLSNACKFSPPLATVELQLVATERTVRLLVIDHGDGIPEAFRPHLFEPFTQANIAGDRAHGGTGLGLSIAKTFTEAMGGTIGFETAQGIGSTFFVEFPHQTVQHATGTADGHTPSEQPIGEL